MAATQTKNTAAWTPPKNATMPISVVPAVVSVAGMPQGVQKTGATNTPKK